MESEIAPLASKLCTHCGLCCAGALHNAADLEPAEVERARLLGLPLKHGPVPRFALPCPKLAGNVCTIYGERPGVCGKYRCKLLRQLEHGKVDLEQALSKVATAKQLANAARESAGRQVTLPELRQIALQNVPEGLGPDERLSAMRAKLAAITLAVHLDKHFRNQRDGIIIEFT